MSNVAENQGFRLVGHVGDAKTLLAFDLTDPAARPGLAGFTVHVQPPAHDAYFLTNNLRLEHPELHAQVDGESPFSTANAPLHKFRWVHVPGLFHQGLEPDVGTYVYTVTPRYFIQGRLQPLDASRSAAIEVEVAPFVREKLKLGFTRGFTQSQGFVRHFGTSAKFKPKGAELIFDTSAQAGISPDGQPYSFREMFDWCGFTARRLVFETLARISADAGLSLDLFAYDLNEPDICAALIALAPSGRVRIILDDAALHHDPAKPKPEDKLAAAFAAAAPPDSIRRGHFGRYSHDKVMVVRRGGQALSVLTGSTNFSVTGLYVNSNHVLVFDEPDVAALYAGMFDEAWQDGTNQPAFAASDWSTRDFPIGGDVPEGRIAFSPHGKARAQAVLQRIIDRVGAESGATGGNVLFAVMELGGGSNNPVYEALNQLHARQDLFSMGISDNPDGIQLYQAGSAEGLLVTGKPVGTKLPPPFSQVPGVGLGHQIHHKFVVAGFGGADPTLFCGSSNLALGGEQANGDNLIEIHDPGTVTAFAIEALALVDHFQFLDRMAKAPAAANAAAAPPSVPGAAPPVAAPASKQQGAENVGWFLGTTDAWAAKYFDPTDLHCRDRVLFAR